MSLRVRRYCPDDAAATREVFAEAVLVGAAPRYSEAERRDWVPDPAIPPDWGDWLGAHITFVAEERGRVTGFMMIERDGYLNMAFVRPGAMGGGVAGALYDAILDEARTLGLTRLTVAASRFFQGFLARRGWRVVPGLPERPDVTILDTPKDNPQNRAMALDLGPGKENPAMTIRRWNPEGIAAPASRFSHAALVEGAARWLHLSGQVGVAPDGKVADGLAAQLDRCFANVAAGLAAAGMTKADLVKLTVYLTDPSAAAVATYRARRDAFIGEGPAPAATYLVVAGLASPALLAEVDAVAAA